MFGRRGKVPERFPRADLLEAVVLLNHRGELPDQNDLHTAMTDEYGRNHWPGTTRAVLKSMMGKELDHHYLSDADHPIFVPTEIGEAQFVQRVICERLAVGSIDDADFSDEAGRLALELLLEKMEFAEEDNLSA